MDTSWGRIQYVIIVVVIVLLGLTSRRFSSWFPEIINLYLGDALWALMVYFIIKVFFPLWSIIKVGLIGLAFCFLIEISQLYQAPWINSIRQTTLGALVLGFGFLWSDLLAYTLGIVSGVIIDYMITCRTNRPIQKKLGQEQRHFKGFS